MSTMSMINNELMAISRSHKSLRVQSPNESILSARTALLSENYGICRICLDEAHRSKLISPCQCRGSHAHVHKNCLRQWFESTRKAGCEICKTEYTKRPIGMKPFAEWDWPKPLGESVDDKIDYYAGIVWMLFVARIIFMFFHSGYDASMVYLTNMLGKGFLRTFWFATYFLNTLYYSQICAFILHNWWTDHQMYDWDFMSL